MSSVVLDTNVLMVASAKCDASPQCVDACIDATVAAVAGGRIISLDTGMGIIGEHLTYFTPAGRPELGYELTLHVLTHQANPAVCELIDVGYTPDGGGDCLLFPRDTRLAAFDLSDRKFVAVALGSAHHPDSELVTAVDTDFLDFFEPLVDNGVRLTVLGP